MSLISWPDSEAAGKALHFNEGLVYLPELTAEPQSQLREVVGQQVFRAGLQALTLESNAGIQAHFLGLLRDIYVRLGPLTNGPRGVRLIRFAFSWYTKFEPISCFFSSASACVPVCRFFYLLASLSLPCHHLTWLSAAQAV